MSLEAHHFGSDKAQWSFLRHGYFETRATIGRWLSPKRRKALTSLLQIGSGLNPLPDFDNLDFYFTHRGKVAHVGHDLRVPLPYADATFEGVYSEHTLEHMYPAEALRLLGEVYRVLKPGGIFRCSVPDLRKYVDFYEGKHADAKFGIFRSGCEAFWNLTQNHLHRSVWDAAMLKQQMLASGFSSVAERSFNEGGDGRLLVDLEHRAWESLYVEGVR